MENLSFENLSDDEKELLNSARSFLKNSYSPYSQFRVSASVRTNGGKIINGVNVENASYGLSICAERSALVNAVSQGFTQFEKVAIIAKGDSFDTDTTTGPCGACRQFILEFAHDQKKDIIILTATTKLEKIMRTTIYELLPYAFGPADLEL